MKSAFSKLIYGIVALGVFSGLCYFLWKPERPFSLHEGIISTDQRMDARGVGDPSKNSNTKYSNPINKTQSNRSHLNALKNRWATLARESNGIVTKEQKALAIESAEKLLCSEDAIELLDFMHREGMRSFETLVRKSIADLLASSTCIDARKSYIQSSYDLANNRNGHIEYWGYFAGKGCSEEELKSLIGSVKCAEYAQEILFGYNVTLAKTDPLKALKSTLDYSKQQISSYHMEEVYKEMMVAIPADSDFEALEQLFPVEKSNKEMTPVMAGRNELFRQWAKADPSGAVNYIIDVPEKASSGLISSVVISVTAGDPAIGAEWVAKFPEGPYFDEAATAAVSVLVYRDPWKAEQLISKIRDPQMRQEALQYMEDNSR